MRNTFARALMACALVAVIQLQAPGARAQGTQIKPYIMILLDTSSSMLLTPCGSGEGCFWETLGDGSADAPLSFGWGSCCPGIDTGTGLPPVAWDMDSAADDSRLWIAKEVIHDVVSAYGDVTFGLMRYYANECAPPFLCYGDDVYEIVYPAYMDNMNTGLGDFLNPGANFGTPPYINRLMELDLINYQGFASRVDCVWPTYRDCRCTPLTAPGGDVLVGFYEDNQYDIIEWVDHSESYAPGRTAITDHEIRATGFTPLARAIDAAGSYMIPIRAADSYRDCRAHVLVIITDGEDTCDGDPESAVDGLYDGGIASYTIGFAFASATLDDMADYGDDGLRNGSVDAYNASNESELAAAFNDIIRDSVLVEICNDIDDDCDTLVDEGFTKYCDRAGVLGPPTSSLIHCTDPGETVCDSIDDNCDGSVDEGLLNPCGTCGTLTEVCDGLDNDCDTLIDEGGVCSGCVPTGEICNGADDDCDTIVDEGLTRTCGTDVGECVAGTQTCTAGIWSTCVGEVGPTAEICDGLDNDCNGVVDGMTGACEMAPGVADTGECEYGYRMCISGSWSACMGGVGPTAEICDGLDNDCDGTVDDGNPGGGAPCGTDIGVCTGGTVMCVGGVLVCSGGVSPTPEVCDCLDNDCDGSTDEGNPGGGAACGPVTLDGIGLCEAGVMTCGTSCALVCIGAVWPASEECNGQDDDCNTLIDDGITGGATCGSDVGECVSGTEGCVAGAWVCLGEVGPVPEVCDGLDNDCDGDTDEGNPGGGMVCGSDVGICEPGVTLCDTSLTPPAIICFGEVGPVPEVCNGLDDDCNGLVDDGLGIGDECGTDEGECETGHYVCNDRGELECMFGRGPTTEICDCRDNDCDALTDEENPCPEGLCVDCSCAGPCNPTEEWPCPSGKVCMEVEGEDGYWCVGDPCDEITCECGERCLGGTCTDVCDPRITSCPEGQVCMIDDCAGRCVPDDCYATGCAEGERCRAGECETDPCYEVECPAGQFCREGECFDVCGTDVVCEEGYVCHDGECIADPCHGVTCTGGLICIDGECVGDPCEDVWCPPPRICIDGVCDDDPCAYINCPEGYVCVGDTCVDETLVTPDETPEASPDASTEGRDVLATGTGGCAGCTVASARSFPAGGLAGLALLIALVLVRGRRGDSR